MCSPASGSAFVPSILTNHTWPRAQGDRRLAKTYPFECGQCYQWRNAGFANPSFNLMVYINATKPKNRSIGAFLLLL